MAKWTSALFSDIRNKLGNQVVFGSWKGRPYFRGYVIPTNPKTNPQKAVRLQMAAIVALFKANVDTGPKKTEWNDEALSLLISGYNLFTKEGKLSLIAAAQNGAGNNRMTYTLGFSKTYAALYRIKSDMTGLSIIKAAGTLSETPNSTVDDAGATTGTEYIYYIADSRPLVSGDTAPMIYQCCTDRDVNKTAGTAPQAIVTTA